MRPRPRVAGWLAAAFVVCLFYLAALPLILSENLMGRAAFDQLQFHEPVIKEFAAQWPHLRFEDYRSATTPGYHLMLAVVWRFFSHSELVLQLVGSLFTAALLGLFAMATARRAAAGEPRSTAACVAWGVLLTLPVLASIYIFFPGVWLLPDNLGWVFVLGIALVSVRLGANMGRTWAGLVVAAILLLAVVLVRQSHLWAAAMVWAGAWLGAAPVGDGRLVELLSRMSSRIRALIPALLATVPAVAAFAAFAVLWKGLTPPGFVQQYGSVMNFATPGFVLALTGVLSAFFAGFIAPAAWRTIRERPVALAFSLLVALVLAGAPETTYAHEQRSTGLWHLVKAGPMIASHTSVVLLVLAPLGAWTLWGWFSALGPRARWLFLGAIVAFTGAQTTNPLCWQRYIEPFLLMAMGLAAASIHRAEAPGNTRGVERVLRHFSPLARLAGPALLAIALGAITVFSLLHAEAPWNTEIGPDGRRRVIEGGFAAPGKPGETLPPHSPPTAFPEDMP